MATDSQQPAASLAHSVKKGKHNTNLTLQDTVELINSALWYYQKAGGKLRLGNSTTQKQTAILALPGTQVCQKCHQVRLLEQMVASQTTEPDLPPRYPSGVCQKCKGK